MLRSCNLSVCVLLLVQLVLCMWPVRSMFVFAAIRMVVEMLCMLPDS